MYKRERGGTKNISHLNSAKLQATIEYQGSEGNRKALPDAHGTNPVTNRHVISFTEVRRANEPVPILPFELTLQVG